MQFNKAITLVAVIILSATMAHSQSNMQRKFTLCLNPGNIGVKADQNQVLDMAIKYGYEAITPMVDQLAKFSDDELKAFNKKRKKNKIEWGSAGLPVQFRNDEERFQKDLSNLSIMAKALQAAGGTRMNTWIMPTHPSLSYTANMKQHAERLKQCAKVLAQYDIKLGLEYVGPKTLMARSRYPFIRTMGECLELISNIGETNVGLVLDSFHWYCAEDGAEDILNLKPSQIVTVDLNDARSDLSRDDQIDGTRELPAATGVIDVKTFLQSLIDIGYDGPVRTEPFNQSIRDMEDQKALQFNMESLQKALGLLN
ncbi:MAG: sugar phosphate isomerase/epimerase [Cyclobacteriaceae bacterium]